MQLPILVSLLIALNIVYCLLDALLAAFLHTGYLLSHHAGRRGEYTCSEEMLAVVEGSCRIQRDVK